MIFALRAVVVGLGFFGVVYCLLSLLVLAGWRITRLVGPLPADVHACLLFVLRTLPVLASALTTVLLAVPAFLLLESNVIDEDPGTLIFGSCALMLIAIGISRVIVARAITRRAVNAWLTGETLISASVPAGVIHGGRGVPPLLLYGIKGPRVLISQMTIDCLTHDELRIAMQHEMAHMRSKDNLKKLLFQAIAFPGLSSLEHAWQEAAELAADNAAVASFREAIDLAGALIKLADVVPQVRPPALTTGLVDMSSTVTIRIERLLAWNQRNSAPSPVRAKYLILPAVICFLYAMTHFHGALLITHRATEWFIR